MSRVIPFAALLLFATQSFAAIATYTLVDGDPAMVNHWPGLDYWIGTGDDFVDGAPSDLFGSAPNAQGSYCYNALDWLWDGTTDEGMPEQFSAMTFVSGMVDIDLDVAASDIPVGSSLITALDITAGTEPFPGHGAFTATFENIRLDSYNPTSGAFLFRAELVATIMGSADTALNMGLGGTAWVVNEEDYGTGIGETYVDSHLIPLAQARGASSFVYILASGTVPPAEDGAWGSMQYLAVLVGLSDVTPTESSSLSAIKALY